MPAPNAGDIGRAGNFVGNRQDFAAIESEVAQRARIELAQREISGSCLLAALRPGDQSAH